ncbi:MAG TPA: hypothetical protein VJZ26_17335 [Blastocatellia bacterium]|nr:hypothetical protein [Blastocatellia bacterium]
MINILSINCGLAFGPYLAESAGAFLNDGEFASRVVRQGGNGLIIRSDSEMMLRYQHHESALGPQEALHYGATVSFRNDFYDVRRLQDEIVIANVGDYLLLSHPQSELWLESAHVSNLLRAFGRDSAAPGDSSGLPDWMTISAAAGRLLISDQRTGRWVLLGRDHIEELERRLPFIETARRRPTVSKPPTITVKGVSAHLQSAFKLAEALESFAETGEVAPFDEATPAYRLAVGKATEGIELRDSERRAALTAREARKWAGVIKSELERVNAAQFERGRIRTVVADAGGGRWVLQWGDEIFVSDDALAMLRPGQAGNLDERAGSLKAGRTGDFVLLLAPATGATVALTDSEQSQLIDLRGRASQSS